MNDRYPALIAALAALHINARFQNKGQLVVSTQTGQIWPDAGNSFWLTFQGDCCYLSTWGGFAYRIPSETSVPALCVSCMNACECAMGSVPDEIVQQYGLTKLSREAYEQLLNQLP